MKKIVIVLVVCFSSLVNAQQLPMFSQYLTNDFILNPAIAGSKQHFPIQINSRSQWTGLGSNAPKTNTLSYHMPVAYNSLGVGAIICQDQTGPYSQLGVNISLAYHIQLNNDNNTRLSFGISGLLTQHKLNFDELTFNNPEPDFEGGVFSKLVPDASFGMYLYSKKLALSLSSHQLFESVFKESVSDIFGDNTQVRHYFAHTSYLIDIYSDLAVVPSVLIKYTEVSPVQFDFNTKVIFDNSYWAGLSLRSSKSLVLLGGVNMGKMSISYSYDYGIGSLGSAASGSHEITLGLNINDQRKRRHSYFW